MNLPEPERHELIGSILMDKEGVGLRSQYPKYYIWKDDKLYLVGWIGLYNMGAGTNSTKEINSEVSAILNTMNIKHTVQNIIGHSSNQQNLNDYRVGSKESVLKALLNSADREQIMQKS